MRALSNWSDCGVAILVKVFGCRLFKRIGKRRQHEARDRVVYRLRQQAQAVGPVAITSAWTHSVGFLKVE